MITSELGTHIGIGLIFVYIDKRQNTFQAN